MPPVRQVSNAAVDRYSSASGSIATAVRDLLAGSRSETNGSGGRGIGRRGLPVALRFHLMSDYRPTHEALARRRGEGFVALCCCGWIGRERSDRRAASHDAREHEDRVPIRESRRATGRSDPEASRRV